MSSDKKITRRRFFKKGALGTAGIALASTFGAPTVRATPNPSDVIGIGIIGVGVRGIEHLRDIMRIPDAQIRGICDIYTGHMERALKTINDPNVKTYSDYRNLLENRDIDAVIVATPDHLHAKMTIDAAEAGKDIYVEKCLTRTISEAKAIVKAVKRNKIVFQLGHQGRSSPSNARAKEIYNSGILGPVTMVRISTFRNSEIAQWRWYSNYSNFNVPSDADPEHIDWNKFLGDAPKRAFNLRRFFHWRCYWDYGTGIAGDLLSHQWDAVNDIMEVGIAKTCVASGGIYYWDDDREAPDVWNVIYEYPDKNLAITYSCEFQNSHYGSELQLFGKNATLEGGRGLRVFLEPYGERNREMLKKLMEQQKGEKAEALRRGRGETIPIYTYTGEPGLYFTSHMQNFINCVRSREKPRCHIDAAFEEAVTAIMSVIAYKEKRQVTWDPVRQEVV